MLEPMLASLADAPLTDPQLVYEPKYDGIRAIAEIDGERVRLWSRLGNEKTNQFPEIARALGAWGKTLDAPVVLDGEVVALDAKGRPTGFQQLQGRIHVHDPSHLVEGARPDGSSGPRVAYIAFDVLRRGRTDLRDRTLVDRRAALEDLLDGATTNTLRLSEQVRGDGRELYRQAVAQGWEGLIAKHAASLYKSGKRTPDWRKLKIVHEQEFVIGGWTEPRNSRSYFGALLLGVYPETTRARSTKVRKRRATGPQQPTPSPQQPLEYVGHIGTGFNEKELARVMALLTRIETSEPPFKERPKTNERAHWVRPELVAQVRFSEWTADRKLRHPVYLGLRDDKKPQDVRREELGSQGSPGSQGSTGSRGSRSSAGSNRENPSNLSNRENRANPTNRENRANPANRANPGKRGPASVSGSILNQLEELEQARRDGVLTFPDGETLAVTNLHKIFWPKLKLTKGDLFRYYARVAPAILPVLADRPLVLKRFPNGIAAKPFYQHRAPDVPAGIRTADVHVADRRSHIVGGSLKTLMYTTQLAAISQDPWFSRMPHPEFADHVALDLDPSEGVPFQQVLDVARCIRDELARLGATGWAKTSGADGLHVYVPLPAETPYDAGLLFCQIVATVVAHKHPKIATVERSVGARGRRVYVDFLQNILGKTLASAYSVRASEYAGVSTPLSWKEIDQGVDRTDFTIRTVPARLERVGDLWKGLRTSKGVDLARVAAYAKRHKE